MTISFGYLFVRHNHRYISWNRGLNSLTYLVKQNQAHR